MRITTSKYQPPLFRETTLQLAFPNALYIHTSKNLAKSPKFCVSLNTLFLGTTVMGSLTQKKAGLLRYSSDLVSTRVER